jgi:hypothetical protein
MEIKMKTELEYRFDPKWVGFWVGSNTRDISVLVGQTIESVVKDEDDREIIFKTKEGYTYKMYHSQDCCESVYVESVVGDLEDLVGQKIEVAEERTSRDVQSWEEDDGYEAESFTWTFYCIRCVKCSVDIRWYGSSNGYYSEGVSFDRIA